MQQRNDLEELNAGVLRHLHEQCLAQLKADALLTGNQKEELLRQLELPDEQWEPIELSDGTEPISETIIKMRRENSQ